MTTDYIPAQTFSRLLETLTPQNELVLELCMATGMRITDALMIKYADVCGSINSQFPRCSYRYTEQKTGKERVVILCVDWLTRAIDQHHPASPWLFAGRDPQKHRTRQAVWKDLHRAAKLYRVNGQRLQARIGSHTARKIYAVQLYREIDEQGVIDPLEAVRVDMNHKDSAVTFIYALADEISARKRRIQARKRS